MSPEGRTELQQFLGDDGMRRFLRIYLSESKRRLHDMVEGAVNGEPARVRDAVHALIPTSRWVGATGVAQLCEELHRRRDWDRISHEHSELVLRIAELHTAWEQELQVAMPDVVPLFPGVATPEGPSLRPTR